MAPSCLKVTIQSGKFPSCEAPLCRVTLGETSYQTSPQCGNHPRWKTHFAFAYATEPALRFEVVDKNHTVIGYVDIDLIALQSSEEQQFRGKLQLKPTGSIRTSLQFYPRPSCASSLGAFGLRSSGNVCTGLIQCNSPNFTNTAEDTYLHKPSMAPPSTAGLSSNRLLLLVPPDIDGSNDALASLWGDLASSATVKHTPDPTFKKIISEKQTEKPQSSGDGRSRKSRHRRSTGMQDNMLAHPGGLRPMEEAQRRRVSCDPRSLAPLRRYGADEGVISTGNGRRSHGAHSVGIGGGQGLGVDGIKYQPKKSPSYPIIQYNGPQPSGSSCSSRTSMQEGSAFDTDLHHARYHRSSEDKGRLLAKLQERERRRESSKGLGKSYSIAAKGKTATRSAEKQVNENWAISEDELQIGPFGSISSEEN